MKALIFDMDGVLVDVSGSYRLAIKKTAEFFLNEKITLDEIQKLKNLGSYNNDWDLTEKLLLMRNKKIAKDEIIRRFQGFYSKLAKNEKWLLDKDILRRLYSKYSVAILTGRPKNEAEDVLERETVKNLFNVVIAMEDIPYNRQKPDPYGVRLILKKLNAKEAVLFGDTVDDMQAAVRANITAIGVLPPGADGRLNSLLIKNGAKKVLENINDITRVI